MIFFLFSALASCSIVIEPSRSSHLQSKSQGSVQVGSIVYDCLAKSTSQSHYFNCIKNELPKDFTIRKFLFEDFTLGKRRQCLLDLIVDRKEVLASVRKNDRPIENTFFEIFCATIFLKDMVKDRFRNRFCLQSFVRVLMLLLVDEIRHMVIDDILLCLESIKIINVKEDFQMRLRVANQLCFLVKNLKNEDRGRVFEFIKNSADEKLKRYMFDIFNSGRWIVDPIIKKKLKISHLFDEEALGELFIEDNWELFLSSHNDSFIYFIRSNGTGELVRNNSKGFININLKENHVAQLLIIMKSSPEHAKFIAREIDILLKKSPGNLPFFLCAHEVTQIKVKKQKPLSWQFQFKVSGPIQLSSLLYDLYGPAPIRKKTKFPAKQLEIHAITAQLLVESASINNSLNFLNIVNDPKEFIRAINENYCLLKSKFQVAIALYILNCFTDGNLPVRIFKADHYLKVLSLFMIPKGFPYLGSFVSEERILALFNLIFEDDQTRICKPNCCGGLFSTLIKKINRSKIQGEEYNPERLSAILNNVKETVAEGIIGCVNDSSQLFLKPYLSNGDFFFNDNFHLRTATHFIKSVLIFSDLSQSIQINDANTVVLQKYPRFYGVGISSKGKFQITHYKQNLVVNLDSVKYILFFNNSDMISQIDEPDLLILVQYAVKKLISGHPLSKFALFNMQLNCVQIFKRE